MKTFRTMTVIGALAMAATPSFAEDSHHPANAAQPAPPAATAMPDAPQATMGGGMMSGGMMAMMGMMRGGMPDRMMAPAHIEGRIAFLRTELKITEQQLPLWNAVADALRANARSMAGMMEDMQAAMMPSQGSEPRPLLQRLDVHEQMLAARLDSLRQIKTALQPLYAALDDTQKRAADDLLMPGPMGMM
ncbi:Spy/CpxP family protein refolding chaperone [Inquilinus sp. OTU3971]|uniref:Spy/CpxP family protein refolding chaperone n=1 Tax=Inquilinus sp. OTU3971 TaxID=3043855 RepID=UPI00313B4BFD